MLVFDFVGLLPQLGRRKRGLPVRHEDHSRAWARPPVSQCRAPPSVHNFGSVVPDGTTGGTHFRQPRPASLPEAYNFADCIWRCRSRRVLSSAMPRGTTRGASFPPDVSTLPSELRHRQTLLRIPAPGYLLPILRSFGPLSAEADRLCTPLSPQRPAPHSRPRTRNAHGIHPRGGQPSKSERCCISHLRSRACRA